MNSKNVNLITHSQFNVSKNRKDVLLQKSMIIVDDDGDLDVNYEYIDTKDDDEDEKEPTDYNVTHFLTNHVFDTQELENILSNDVEDGAECMFPRTIQTNIQDLNLRVKALVSIMVERKNAM